MECAAAVPGAKNCGVTVYFSRRNFPRLENADECTTAVGVQRHAHAVSAVRGIGKVDIADRGREFVARLDLKLIPHEANPHSKASREVVLQLDVVLVCLLTDHVCGEFVQDI